MAKSSISNQIETNFDTSKDITMRMQNLELDAEKETKHKTKARLNDIRTTPKNFRKNRKDPDSDSAGESPVHYHLPALRVRKPLESPKKSVSKTPYQRRSTSADQEETRKNDSRLLSPVITSLKRDLDKSVSDSALHVGGTAITTNELDPFRRRSSSTSLTQSKSHVTPKISIDKCPEKMLARWQVGVSTNFPLDDESTQSGNLTPPIDRSRKFPRSVRSNLVSPTCKCNGLHEKNCILRAVSRSMENINTTSIADLRGDTRFAKLRSSLFPASYSCSAPGSPSNIQRNFGNPGSEIPGEQGSFQSPITVRKSMLLPRTRSKSANSLRQISPSPLRRKANARQTLPTLKLSIQEFGSDSDERSSSLRDNSSLSNDGSLLAPDRLQIRSPPLTDYATDW